MSDTPTTARLHIYSEVIPGRPVQMLRTGTFTDSYGRETTFTHERLDEMIAAYSQRKNKRLPITERHDFGRAVGRITGLRRVDDSLYGDVAWNKYGRELLADEVYNAFSSEVAMPPEGPWQMMGGSLTNYPAVEGMDAVVLEAPQPEPTPASEPAHAGLDIDAPPLPAPPPSTTETTMDIQEEGRAPEPVPVPAPEPPALTPLTAPTITAADPAVQEQVNAVVAQMTAQFEAQRRIVLEQAQAQFQQQLAQMQAQQAVRTYSQHITTPTMQRQHALPGAVEEYERFLLALSTEQRKTAQTLFDRILDAGLVSFEEIGSEGEAQQERTAAEQFEDAVQAKVKTGMSRLSAIQAVQKEQPDLYSAYSAESSRNGKGGR